MVKLLGALVVAAALASACSSTTEDPEPSNERSAEAVPWGQYAPQVKTRINKAVKAKDCEALQDEFDAAADNDERQRARTGEGNTALMEYLDAALESSGCY